MEFKGTQGKLHLEEIREDNYLSISNENNNSVASISTNEEQYEEAVAYGKLFSKAPEMLEMLQSIIQSFECDYVLDGEIVDNPYEWLIEDYIKAKKLIKEATEL